MASGSAHGLAVICLGAILSASLAAANGGPVPVGRPPEARHLAGAGLATDDPPPGAVMSPPEWAPAEGTIIAWMWSDFYAYLADLVDGFQEAGTCWIVVGSASQQTQATNYLTSHGVPLTNVEFIVNALNTLWIVDFGPFFVSAGGARAIVDHMYPGRPLDDAFPVNLGTRWGIPSYTSDLRIEGGNFYPDGQGNCFITRYVYEQNAGYLSESEVRDRLRDYCGCETVQVLEYLADYTGHIDMFFKLLDPDTVLLGQYQLGDPEYDILEGNAATLAGLTAPGGGPYEVIRIPMPGSPGAYWTYTNSTIVNDHVFVPTYNVELDATALQIYADAMPESTVVGIDSSVPIAWGGAVHCTSKVVAEHSAATPTPAASPSQVPTATPIPTATPTATPTPAATATAVPSATPAHTATPAASATPEPSTTPAALWIDLAMADTELAAGDPFELRRLCGNPAADAVDVDEYIILDVLGEYWFYPSWTQEMECVTGTLAPGETRDQALLAFTWPDGAGALDGVRFWGAFLAAGTADLLVYDMIEWGFGTSATQ